MSAERVASELTVAILPLGEISPWQIKLTKLVLKKIFGVETMIMPAMEPPIWCFNAEQNYYPAKSVLDFLFSQLPANAQRIMGVIKGDLRFNGTSSCLGYADFYDGTTVYDNALCRSGYILRFVITHEFGHTLGLKHCHQPDCAMHPNSYNAEMCACCHRWADRELRVKPGSAEERFSRAEALRRHNCLPEAIAAYRQAILQSPNEPLYIHRLGRALEKVGKKDEANQLLIPLFESTCDTNYATGLTFINYNPEKAEEYFAKAIAAAENPQRMQRLVGQAYREIAHDVERASRHYLEYLRLGGDDQDVVDWLVSRSVLMKT